MYFNVEGKMDVSEMFSTAGGIDAQKFCKQILENNLKVTGVITCAEVEEWRKYYHDMNPKQYLIEDVLPDSITDDEIKATFEKFFKPLNVDACALTIIDPYIFARGTNVTLLVDILKTNVTSKQIRFVTTLSKADATVKSDVENQLKLDGFVLKIEDRVDIHDRWWYTRIKGFSSGTSFNGLSRKTTTINILPDQDLNDIISIYGI